MTAFKLTLAELRERIAHLEGQHQLQSGVHSFGIPHLDTRLPNGGLALGALHEVAGGGNGAVDGAAAACFAAGIVARIEGTVLWCLSQTDIYAPGLEQAGLTPDSHRA